MRFHRFGGWQAYDAPATTEVASSQEISVTTETEPDNRFLRGVSREDNPYVRDMLEACTPSKLINDRFETDSLYVYDLSLPSYCTTKEAPSMYGAINLVDSPYTALAGGYDELVPDKWPPRGVFNLIALALTLRFLCGTMLLSGDGFFIIASSTVLYYVFMRITLFCCIEWPYQKRFAMRAVTYLKRNFDHCRQNLGFLIPHEVEYTFVFCAQEGYWSDWKKLERDFQTIMWAAHINQNICALLYEKKYPVTIMNIDLVWKHIETLGVPMPPVREQPCLQSILLTGLQRSGVPGYYADLSGYMKLYNEAKEEKKTSDAELIAAVLQPLPKGLGQFLSVSVKDILDYHSSNPYSVAYRDHMRKGRTSGITWDPHDPIQTGYGKPHGRVEQISNEGYIDRS